MGIAWARSGKTKGGWVYQIKTWNYAVNDVVKEKQHKWKQWKLGGKEGYQLMKKAACQTAHDAKQQAYNSDDDDDDDDDELFLWYGWWTKGI